MDLTDPVTWCVICRAGCRRSHEHTSSKNVRVGRDFDEEPPSEDTR